MRQSELYQTGGAEQIGVHGSMGDETIEGASVVRAHLLAEEDMVRHDPLKLARTILACASY